MSSPRERNILREIKKLLQSRLNDKRLFMQHKELIVMTGMHGEYYGSPTYHEVEKAIKEPENEKQT